MRISSWVTATLDNLAIVATADVFEAIRVADFGGRVVDVAVQNMSTVKPALHPLRPHLD
jgi:hypothetical protein